jgi:ankyrin repeat protein
MKFLEARSGYVAAFGKEHPPGLISQYGRTLLSFAAREGHEDIVKWLLETGDPDIKDRMYSRTPLLCAAQNRHEAVVKLLLETSNAEVDSKDNGGQTPLSYAAQKGHEAVVKLLRETAN